MVEVFCVRCFVSMGFAQVGSRQARTQADAFRGGLLGASEAVYCDVFIGQELWRTRSLFFRGFCLEAPVALALGSL